MSGLSYKDSQCRWPQDQEPPLCLEHGKTVSCCTHATAALERRVEHLRIEVSESWDAVEDVKRDLARLEEEKAQAEIASRDWEEAYARTKLERDEAETREAAMG